MMVAHWTKEEIESLTDLAGTDHFYEICKKYRRKAQKEGWTRRTNEAIRCLMIRHDIPREAIYGGWNTKTLAEYLDVSAPRIRYWIKSEKLKAEKVKGVNTYRILESDLKKFAKTYPELLHGIDKLFLSQFLDEKTIALVPDDLPGSKPIALYSTKTGRTYPSLKAASKAEFFGKTTIRLCIREDRPTQDGTRFIPLNKRSTAA